ncbi:MAG: rod shape-determining protein RodA [Acidobacteria bacterium]|nr:rod shape-determining protein RodA [Acidobacteriota bacterium]
MRWLTARNDIPTLLHLLVLGGIGVIAVTSATHMREPSFWGGSGFRQLVFVLAGLAVYWLVQRLDYRTWADFWVPAYLAGVASLALLFVFARPIANTRAWYELGSLRFQPSEPMKAIVALAAAAFLSESAGKLDFWRLAKLAAIVGLPIGLIVLQPDMGSALTFVPLFLVLAWLAGIRARVLVVLALVALLVAPIGWFKVLKPYQKERIVTLFDPERDPSGSGYQVIQSKIAVGSGRVFGRGLFHGSQSRLDYLPARETDFVLGVIAEETGFIGVLAVLGLYLSLILRALETAALARDQLGTYLAAGIAAIWAGQLFVNTGMVTGVFPTVGVPLPVLSYGGSSVLATFLAFALVGSVRSGRIVNQ